MSPTHPIAVIRSERPDQLDVAALLGELDAYLAVLYRPEANHILDVAALLAPEVTFCVARDGAARAVATGACRQQPAEAATGGRPYGEIKRMYVAPAQRGNGLGARMLSELERRLREAGLTLALLETGADQHEAVKLYERAGYVRRGAFGGYPDNGLSRFYEKALR